MNVRTNLPKLRYRRRHMLLLFLMVMLSSVVIHVDAQISKGWLEAVGYDPCCKGTS